MGKTSSAAKNRYNDKAYDRLYVVVAKGQKEIITEHAAGRGESLNAYINRAVAELMAREQAEQAEK